MVLCALGVPRLSAKDTKINLSETVLYLGEAEKKIPTGNGTLYVMDRPSKEPVLRQDVITGQFNGNSVSNAKVEFSSGWKFEGSLKYLASQQSKRPLTTTFSYVLSGLLFSADGKSTFKVEDFPLERRTIGDMGSLELVINNKYFEIKQKTREGDFADYQVLFETDGDKWKPKAVLKVAPAVYFTGGVPAQTPQGRGTLSVLASDKCDETHVFDKIMGDFSGNTVNNATVSFSSGWSFKGNLSYGIVEKWADPYSLEVSYTLTGLIYDPDGKEQITMEGDVLVREVKESSITLNTFSWNEELPGEVRNYDNKYKDFIKEENKALVPAILTLSDKDNVWSHEAKIATKFIEYHFPSGFVLTEFEDGFNLHYPNADYFEIRDSRLVGLFKSFPEAFLYFNNEESKIVYTNGDVYEGSFQINSLKPGSWLGDRTMLQALMDPDVFLDEVTLMYIDGTFTYANGKTEKWDDGKTDYQRNRINGNYERAYAQLTQLERERRAEKGAELEKKWQAALPELRREYGRSNVDAIYEYRLNRKTPVELFKDLSRLGLIRLVGPIYSPHLKDTVNEYVIYMTNRETGEEQYSVVLKFVHPFWSSPDWILDSYSSDFSN